MIPIFIGLDQSVQRLLKIASGELPEVIDLSSEDKPETAEVTEESKRTNIKHFAPLIIKIFRKKVMKDEEMGPVMLDKIKSQGVRELDDSAMIMRVKFKTIPGEQFAVRREVFRMMQEMFRKNGIEFAHRNVTVYLPPEEKGGGAAEDAKKEKSEGRSNKKLAEAAAAAAAAAIQAEENAKLKAGPPKK